MAKLDDLIQQKQQRDEDWKAKKTAEREELGQLSDDAVMHVTSEPGAYLHYLDTQAINPRYSASNVMLAMAQNPEITYINSLEVWNRLGRSVNRDENGMKIRVSDTYVKDGREYLGTLKIPTLGLSVKVYQGTDADALRKGAGHFASTSIWEGNVAIAGHNRGVNNHFGKIHTLDIGDTIKLTTQLGTRSYEVYSVSKIGVDDTSVLNDSTENIITLVTCVMNQPDYRWCVQARQK